MKVGKVVVTGSNNVTRIEVRGGGSGAVVFCLIATAGVLGMVKMYQTYAELQKEIERIRATIEA